MSVAADNSGALFEGFTVHHFGDVSDSEILPGVELGVCFLEVLDGLTVAQGGDLSHSGMSPCGQLLLLFTLMLVGVLAVGVFSVVLSACLAGLCFETRVLGDFSFCFSAFILAGFW